METNVHLVANILIWETENVKTHVMLKRAHMIMRNVGLLTVITENA